MLARSIHSHQPNQGVCGMVKDDQEHREETLPTDRPEHDSPTGLRRPAWKLVALAVIAAAISIAAVMHGLQPSASSPAEAGAPPPKAPQLFRDWPTDKEPDVVLVLSGQAYGYMQPCGCSRPQLGGLERRYNFIQSLKQRNWPVVAIDLGDVAQRSGPQSQLKYGYAMRALQAM